MAAKYPYPHIEDYECEYCAGTREDAIEEEFNRRLEAEDCREEERQIERHERMKS